MQGPVRLKVFVALLLSLAVAAFAAEAELSAEVPAEKWRALRLKGLTQGASLRVRVETSGPIRVILAREDEVQRFPQGLKPTFSGSASVAASISSTCRAPGVQVVALVPVAGPVPPPMNVVTPLANASYPCCGQMK